MLYHNVKKLYDGGYMHKIWEHQIKNKFQYGMAFFAQPFIETEVLRNKMKFVLFTIAYLLSLIVYYLNSLNV